MTNKSELPSFITNGTRTDKVIFSLFLLVAVYSLALIPFRAKLLVSYPLLNLFLTGGNFSLVSLTAQNSDNLPLIAGFLLLAAVSAIKFLPLYFIIGRRWGKTVFEELLFKSHTPLWFRKLENFIYRFPAIALGIAFIPFSPVSGTAVTIAAGIAQVSWRKFLTLVFIFSCLLKTCYVAIGLVYGPQVLEILPIIDRYMLWLTVALILYVGFVVYRKQK